MQDWQVLAEILVDEYVAPQGVANHHILDAMKRVPRHLFIPGNYQKYAYDDSPLPIGEEQTISQPFIVAKMTELLDVREGENVLEIGTGSGYQAGLLAEMGIRVTTIERIEELALQAREVFNTLNYPIRSVIGDGRTGFAECAPYDGVIVTAGAPDIEAAWFDQLRENGKIVAPVTVQEGIFCLLVRKKISYTAYEDTWYDYCRFVPLLEGVKKKTPME